MAVIALRSQRDLHLEKLARRREEELGKLREEFGIKTNHLEAKFQDQQRLIEQGYLIGAGKKVAETLNFGWQELNDLGKTIPEISEEDLRSVQSVYNIILHDLGPDKGNKVKEMLGAVNASVGVISSLDYLLNNERREQSITSYLSAGKAGETVSCYLLTPLRKTDAPNPLISNFEGKLIDIIMLGEVVAFGSETAERGHRKSSFTYKFNADGNYGPHGFFAFPIKPEYSDEESARNIADLLQKKLIELQPPLFGLAKLRHNVELIEMSVLNHFNSHSLEDIAQMAAPALEIFEEGVRKEGPLEIGTSGAETYVSLESASELTGLKSSSLKRLGSRGIINRNQEGMYERASLEKYLISKPVKKAESLSEQKISEWREKAFLRLKSYEHAGGEYLTIPQMQGVLDVPYSAARHLAKTHFKKGLAQEKQGEKRVVYFVPLEDLRLYIANYSPYQSVDETPTSAIASVDEKDKPLLRKLAGFTRDRRIYVSDIAQMTGVHPTYANMIINTLNPKREETGKKRLYITSRAFIDYVRKYGAPVGKARREK